MENIKESQFFISRWDIGHRKHLWNQTLSKLTQFLEKRDITKEKIRHKPNNSLVKSILTLYKIVLLIV